MANLFAVCTPGLEPFMAGELSQLGLGPSRSPSRSENLPTANELIDEVGGIEFQGSLPDFYRANLHLRMASRVLLQLGAFYADTFSDLRRRAKRLSWENYLRPGQSVSLRVTCHQSRLYHSGGVAERVLEAIADRLGQTPPVRKLSEDEEGNPPQLIIVRLRENRCAISLDSSGAIIIPPWLPAGDGQGPLAGDPGCGNFVGFRLGCFLSSARPFLRGRDHRH